jgi:hypothetical protein
VGWGGVMPTGRGNCSRRAAALPPMSQHRMPSRGLQHAGYSAHLVPCLVTLDWNHGAHAAHGKAAALVARLHNQLHTGRAGQDGTRRAAAGAHMLICPGAAMPLPICAAPAAPLPAPPPTHRCVGAHEGHLHCEHAAVGHDAAAGRAGRVGMRGRQGGQARQAGGQVWMAVPSSAMERSNWS